MHYNMFIPAASSAYSPMEWDCGDALFCSEVLEVELGQPSKTHALMIQSFINCMQMRNSGFAFLLLFNFVLF